MKSLIILTAAAALLLASEATAHTQETARLEIAVDIAAPTGAVMIALYDSEANYEGGGAPVQAFRLDVTSGKTSVKVENLTPGTYAIRSYHDVNGNGLMDTNPFGMPTEPYAFSNNAVGNMGPAKWERARFEVSGDVTQTLNLR